MPNKDSLIQVIPKKLSLNAEESKSFFTMRDLQYAYSQLNLHPGMARQNKYNILSGNNEVIYQIKTGFFGLTDKPAVFQEPSTQS